MFGLLRDCYNYFIAAREHLCECLARLGGVEEEKSTSRPACFNPKHAAPKFSKGSNVVADWQKSGHRELFTHSFRRTPLASRKSGVEPPHSKKGGAVRQN